MEPEAQFNPFPGLRPFEPDEDHLFFGREKQIDELLRKLRTNRFLAVIGSSGSGKSSLVLSGLIPSLYSGMMANTGSNWRVAILRPGVNPIGNLASALNQPDVLRIATESPDTSRILLDVTLRRSTSGLIDAVTQARIPARDNALVLVDQFEELFRFRNSLDIEKSKDEAAAFVKLLLEAVQQEVVPIYIVLTMRADFVGDCMNFVGLPEAVNAGQYLVPRMTRDQLRRAITGPVAVGGGEIAPRLVARLLNDCGDDPDQLPVLQHALMRTWDYWSKHGEPGAPIEISDYEAIGTMREALSRHAEEAYEEARSADSAGMAERMFKALTDTSGGGRGVRRPTSVEELAAICETTEAKLISAVEIFRRPGRSFLTPSASTLLDSRCIIDLSHESLMRGWTRLIKWTEEERASAEYYVLVAQAARLFENGTAGLWRNPELEFGLRWRAENHPSAAWARRIDPNFERAMSFLDRSAEERDRLSAERRKQRRRKLTLAWSVASVLAVLLMITGWLAAVAFRERSQAQRNLQLTKDTVDSLLASAGSQSAQIAAESPEVAQFRRSLVEQAKATYAKILAQGGRAEFTEEIALVNMRLGDGDRITGRTEQAIAEYKKAVKEFQRLASASPRTSKYLQELAAAYDWLGETERPIVKYRGDAEKAYDSAFKLQHELHDRFPKHLDYQLMLARTYYNRGILWKDSGRAKDAEADYREAIRLLTPLAARNSSDKSSDQYKQELARAENNLARLMFDANLPGDPSSLYEDAIRTGNELIRKQPDNRDYKFELAQYYDNFATSLESQRRLDSALTNSGHALALYEELTRPLPLWTMHLGLMHNIRGRILETKNPGQAESEYQQSIDAFRRVAVTAQTADYHLWFGQTLANMANLLEQKNDDGGAVPLLLEAVDQHRQVGSKYDLAWDYYFLAAAYKRMGSAAAAENSTQELSRLLPDLPPADQETLRASLRDLKAR